MVLYQGGHVAKLNRTQENILDCLRRLQAANKRGRLGRARVTFDQVGCYDGRVVNALIRRGLVIPRPGCEYEVKS